MTLTRIFVLSVLVAAPAIASVPALAQQKAPAAAPAAQAPKAAPAAAKPKKAASPCQGLAETACKTNTACSWIVPKKSVSTSGKKLKSYCRKTAGVAKPKTAAAKPKS